MGSFTLDATVVIFLVTYAGIAIGYLGSLKLDRVGIALVGAILMLLVGAIPFDAAVRSVDFATIVTLFGLMVLSAQLRIAGFYTWVAERIASFVQRPTLFLAVLMGASAALSAVLINDVVCLAFAPVIAAALLRAKINPMPYLVALAVAANIGSAATPIGNPQNILIGQVGNLRFGAFLLWTAVPVLLSLAAAYGILWKWGGLGREMPDAPEIPAEHLPDLDRAQTLRGLIVAGALVIGFFTPIPHAYVALAAAAAILCSRQIDSHRLMALVDWPLVVMFCSLFVLVQAFVDTRLPEEAVGWLDAQGVDLGNLYVLGTVTGVLSNLISNVPAVMLLISLRPIEDPVTGYMLALTSTFAGNLILLGSIANLIVAEQAARLGYKLSFSDFAKFGIPITLISFGITFGWYAIAG